MFFRQGSRHQSQVTAVYRVKDLSRQDGADGRARTANPPVTSERPGIAGSAPLSRFLGASFPSVAPDGVRTIRRRAVTGSAAVKGIPGSQVSIVAQMGTRLQVRNAGLRD
jgi:hypothetical protein